MLPCLMAGLPGLNGLAGVAPQKPKQINLLPLFAIAWCASIANTLPMKEIGKICLLQYALLQCAWMTTLHLQDYNASA